MVSVILCTLNRAATLEAALESLVRIDAPAMPWEIVIVDNNSTDHTADVIRRWEARSTVPVVGVRETRQGKSFALNRGMVVARGELLAFSDDDVTFDHAWLARLTEPFASPDVMGVGGRIEPVWSRPPPRWWSGSGPYRLKEAIVYFDRGPDQVDLTSPPTGANMAFRRTVFERLGGFREDLGRFAGTLLGGEDVELGRRVLDAGCRVVYAPRALVYHPVEPRRMAKSYFRRWYFDQGRTIARWEGRPAATVYWHGVPRYLVRQLVAAVGKALGMAWSRHAFFWELKGWYIAGLIHEYWRTRGVDAVPEGSRAPSVAPRM
jgi:glycosyltransferase involved in cell wall biosynthesis